MVISRRQGKRRGRGMERHDTPARRARDDRGRGPDRASSRRSTRSWPSARASWRPRSSPPPSRRWRSARSPWSSARRPGAQGPARPAALPDGRAHGRGARVGLARHRAHARRRRRRGGDGLGTARGVGDPRPVRLPRPRQDRPHAGAPARLRAAAGGTALVTARCSGCHSVAGERRRPRAAPALPRRRSTAARCWRGWPRARCPASRRSTATSTGAACACRTGRASPSWPSTPTSCAAACGSRTSATSRPPSSAAGGCSTSTPTPAPSPTHLGLRPAARRRSCAPRPGLRVPGAVDGAELAVRAVLGPADLGGRRADRRRPARGRARRGARRARAAP